VARLVPLALAVAVSFVIAAPLNRVAHGLYGRVQHGLVPFEQATYHPDEQPTSLSGANVLVVGTGRTGTASLDFLADSGVPAVGVDADPTKVANHRAAGRQVVYADVEDVTFWETLDLGDLQAVILAMPEVEGKLIATRHLRRQGFRGPIIANALFEEDVATMRRAGADEAYLTMVGAGRGLAGKVCRAIRPSLGTG